MRISITSGGGKQATHNLRHLPSPLPLGMQRGVGEHPLPSLAFRTKDDSERWILYYKAQLALLTRETRFRRKNFGLKKHTRVNSLAQALESSFVKIISQLINA